MNELHAPPFLLQGDATGVLLIHGFTASPTEMRPLGAILHHSGFTVSGIRLPGHGTSLQDLEATDRHDWYAAAEEELIQLRDHCSDVFVCGLSMGAILAILLTARHPASIAGISLLCPALYLRTPFLFLAPWLRPFIRAVPKSAESRRYLAERALFSYPSMPTTSLTQLYRLIAEGRRQLPRITCPLQLFMGLADRTVAPASALRLFRTFPSAAKELVFLPGADHILTTEPGADLIFERVTRFIAHHTHKKRSTA